MMKLKELSFISTKLRDILDRHSYLVDEIITLLTEETIFVSGIMICLI